MANPINNLIDNSNPVFTNLITIPLSILIITPNTIPDTTPNTIPDTIPDTFPNTIRTIPIKFSNDLYILP